MLSHNGKRTYAVVTTMDGSALLSEVLAQRVLRSVSPFSVVQNTRGAGILDNGLRVGDVALCCACGKAILLTRC
jgi:hypothetical protein